MSDKIHYENKKWFRKAVTLLIDNAEMFEAVDKQMDPYSIGNYQLGVKYYADGWFTTYPECEEDIEIIASNIGAR
ncbi:hypothetical protein FACS18942_05740 [Planctomycetales bacterium]|nr:hypothetical protein FACS18942_05740 [Planctomycetales bacterium]